MDAINALRIELADAVASLPSGLHSEFPDLAVDWIATAFPDGFSAALPRATPPTRHSAQRAQPTATPPSPTPSPATWTEDRVAAASARISALTQQVAELERTAIAPLAAYRDLLVTQQQPTSGGASGAPANQAAPQQQGQHAQQQRQLEDSAAEPTGVTRPRLQLVRCARCGRVLLPAAAARHAEQECQAKGRAGSGGMPPTAAATGGGGSWEHGEEGSSESDGHGGRPSGSRGGGRGGRGGGQGRGGKRKRLGAGRGGGGRGKLPRGMDAAAGGGIAPSRRSVEATSSGGAAPNGTYQAPEPPPSTVVAAAAAAADLAAAAATPKFRGPSPSPTPLGPPYAPLPTGTTRQRSAWPTRKRRRLLTPFMHPSGVVARQQPSKLQPLAPHQIASAVAGRPSTPGKAGVAAAPPRGQLPGAASPAFKATHLPQPSPQLSLPPASGPYPRSLLPVQGGPLSVGRLPPGLVLNPLSTAAAPSSRPMLGAASLQYRPPSPVPLQPPLSMAPRGMPAAGQMLTAPQQQQQLLARGQVAAVRGQHAQHAVLGQLPRQQAGQGGPALQGQQVHPPQQQWQQQQQQQQPPPFVPMGPVPGALPQRPGLPLPPLSASMLKQFLSQTGGTPILMRQGSQQGGPVGQPPLPQPTYTMIPQHALQSRPMPTATVPVAQQQGGAAAPHMIVRPMQPGTMANPLPFAALPSSQPHPGLQMVKVRPQGLDPSSRLPFSQGLQQFVPQAAPLVDGTVVGLPSQQQQQHAGGTAVQGRVLANGGVHTMGVAHPQHMLLQRPPAQHTGAVSTAPVQGIPMQQFLQWQQQQQQQAGGGGMLMGGTSQLRSAATPDLPPSAQLHQPFYLNGFPTSRPPAVKAALVQAGVGTWAARRGQGQDMAALPPASAALYSRPPVSGHSLPHFQGAGLPPMQAPVSAGRANPSLAVQQGVPQGYCAPQPGAGQAVEQFQYGAAGIVPQAQLAPAVQEAALSAQHGGIAPGVPVQSDATRL